MRLAVLVRIFLRVLRKTLVDDVFVQRNTQALYVCRNLAQEVMARFNQQLSIALLEDLDEVINQNEKKKKQQTNK